MMEIRQAKDTEYDVVRSFYHSLIDAVEGAQYKPRWEKDVYPSNEFIRHSIECGELYLGTLQEEAAACMVLNHDFNEGYRRVSWPIDAPREQVTVIHALGVHPRFSGRGFGRQLVRYAVDYVRRTGQRALRLDVLKGNLPAEKLYESMGFQYLTTVNMFYEDTGWTDYELYEYAVAEDDPSALIR